jgi:hypothetical protein
MSVNVQNGTPRDGPSLCDSWANVHVARGYRTSEAVVA